MELGNYFITFLYYLLITAVYVMAISVVKKYVKIKILFPKIYNLSLEKKNYFTDRLKGENSIIIIIYEIIF